MDKNTWIGLLLIAAILIGYSYYATPTQAPVPTEQLSPATKKVGGKAGEVKSVPTQSQAEIDSTDIFFAAKAAQPAPVVTLQNSKVQVEVSPRGGTISAVRLKNYKSYRDFAAGNDGAMLTLFDDSTSQMNLQFETVNGVYRAEAYDFAVQQRTDSTLMLALGARTGDTLYVDYRLLKDSYMVNVTVRTKGRIFNGKHINLQWADKVRQQEKGLYFENMYSTLTYKESDGDTEKLNEYKHDEQKPEKSVDWVAFKNQYFSAILIAGKQPFAVDKLESDTCGEGSGFVKSYLADVQIPADFSKAGAEWQFYFGPNQYRYLQKMESLRLADRELELQGLVYLGWPIVRWINRFFTIYVFDFLTGFGMNMGIVLLLITLLLRVLVYPTTRKSFLSSAKMRVLKPKIDELSKKYPKQEDALKKQQEMMQLYSQYGVSPMGGCLPMLIQMPIWIAMFNFVPNAFELRQQSFLWAEDLSTYDSLITFGRDVWLLGDHLSLFCILFCVTNLLYSWLMMRQQQETMSGEQAQQMKVMQWMMFLMPVFFFFMFNKYSSGLNYYYFISLLASALTMWYLRRTTDDAKILARLEENYKANKNNPAKKPSGLAARLQALQEQQEELKKRQQNIGRR